MMIDPMRILHDRVIQHTSWKVRSLRQQEQVQKRGLTIHLNSRTLRSCPVHQRELLLKGQVSRRFGNLLNRKKAAMA